MEKAQLCATNAHRSSEIGALRDSACLKAAIWNNVME
jgi:hypothetical protein